jgi:hypothetical protein
LCGAIDDMVALGWSESVRQAWEDTAEQRPVVVRTAPAYRGRPHDTHAVQGAITAPQRGRQAA